MGIGIGSVVSVGLSVLPKIAEPIAAVAKKVGLNNVSSFVTAGASAVSGGKSGGGTTMKDMNMKFILNSLQKMRDDATAKYQEAMKKGDPGAV